MYYDLHSRLNWYFNKIKERKNIDEQSDDNNIDRKEKNNLESYVTIKEKHEPINQRSICVDIKKEKSFKEILIKFCLLRIFFSWMYIKKSTFLKINKSSLATKLMVSSSFLLLMAYWFMENKLNPKQVKWKFLFLGNWWNNKNIFFLCWCCKIESITHKKRKFFYRKLENV